MKIVLRILGILVLVIAIAATGGIVYLKTAYPKAGPVAQVKVSTDTATLARGEYLARHVTGCVECHSMRDPNYFGLPAVPGTEGKGGMAFNRDLGLPGVFYSRNITPAGIGSWSDDQFFHTITTGVDKNGEPLFPIMPYTHYGAADPEDIEAIMAYIRTLKPIEGTVPTHEVDFPMNLIMRTIPMAGQPVKRPAESDTIAYGKYLVNLAGCEDCHTPMEKGQPIAGMQVAGGHEYHLQGIGTVRAANITPDKETGIGSWDKDMFITAIKSYDSPEKHHMPWKDRGYQTVMPWLEYCGMKEGDLAAIFRYLQTLPPVKNKVVKFTPEGETAQAN